MDEKAELRKSVLINLRCVVESCQNGIPISCLQNEYRMLVGTVIPFQSLGFNSLELFLADNPDVVHLRRSNGTIIVEAVPNSLTSHLTKLISKQKPSKKRTRRYANRFRSTNRNSSYAQSQNFKTSKYNPNTTTVDGQISSPQTSQGQFTNTLNTPSTSKPTAIHNSNNKACGTNSVSQNIPKQPLNKVSKTSQNCPKNGKLPPDNEPQNESPPIANFLQSFKYIPLPGSNEAEPLAFLQNHLQFQQIRQVIRLNPHLLSSILVQIGQNNPQLLLLICQNQEEFVRILNEPSARGPLLCIRKGALPASVLSGNLLNIPLESTSPLKETTANLSSQDRKAVERIYMVAQEYGGLRTFVLLHMENVARGYKIDTDLKCFQRDCEKSMGIPFPCQELGYATFKDFVSSINNHFKTRNSKKGNLIIKGNASISSTSSSCSITSQETKQSAPMEKENLETEVQCVLNMLTHRNFEILLTQLQSLSIYTEENLKIVVNLILEKAIDEPDCSMDCANLCKHLAVFGKFENIRQLLHSKCQTEFEQGLKFRMKLAERKNYIEAAKRKKDKEIYHEFIELKEKMRLRQLGIIRFIGELFKFNLFIESIIYECIEKLLEQGDEESLECLCLLLKAVGKKLKKSKQNENKLNKIVTEIERIIKEELTTSRVSFMLQDFIDLKTEPVYQSTSHNSCIIERNLSLNSSNEKTSTEKIVIEQKIKRLLKLHSEETLPDSKVIEQKSKGPLKLHPEVKKNVLASCAKTLSALYEFIFGATFLDILRAKILSFNGFAFSRDSEEWKDKELLLSLLDIDELRNFSNLLCIQYSKEDTEDVLIEKILTFLTDLRTKS